MPILACRLDRPRVSLPVGTGARPGSAGWPHRSALRQSLIGLMACLALAGCGRATGPTAPDRAATTAGEVSAAVQQQLAAAAQGPELRDPQPMADARRGLLAVPQGQVKDASGRVLWDFDAYRFVQGEAPPSVHPGLWRQATLLKQTGLFLVHDSPAGKIWQLRGFDLANISLIQGRTGWIVVDTGTSRETAAFAMAFARQHLGQQPVSAVIFTHSHVDHFGGALGVITAQEVHQRQVPIVAPAGFMDEATSENLMMGVAMGRRAQYMFGTRLPKDARGKVGDGLGLDTALGSIGILAPTLVIEQPREERVIDGVRFIFHNVPGSEAPSEFVFQLPDFKAFNGAEIMGHTLHNIYTLRGAKVRDALKWAQYLDQSLQWVGDAEVVFNQHHWPVWGQERIRAFIEMQRDAYKFIHDQTVRQLNGGRHASEIAETLKLPPALQAFMSVRGYYGTVSHNVKGVAQHYLGWYDANPASLHPLPPRDVARRYVALGGGADPVVASARAAFDQGDFRWAAELLKHVLHAEPGHAAARALQAQAFEQMGYLAEASSWRNAYLSGAFELRHGPPDQGISLSTLRDLLQHAPIERFLDRMAASIDGERAADLALTINLSFSDLGQTHVMTLRHGVMHHRRQAPDPAAQATLTLTKPFFLQMMTGEAGAKELLLSDQVRISGSRLDLARFLSMLERTPGNFSIVTR
jgi:alkyl sulfatase BDS1-like metallo-beta-lactamase superfamily hydrolase